jgi:Ca2+/Na+ antiporter
MMAENGSAFPVALKSDQGQRGETLVRGASRLAAASVPPLIIGLRVVAIGTSSPKIAVMAQAGSAGSSNSS